MDNKLITKEELGLQDVTAEQDQQNMYDYIIKKINDGLRESALKFKNNEAVYVYYNSEILDNSYWPIFDRIRDEADALGWYAKINWTGFDCWIFISLKVEQQPSHEPVVAPAPEPKRSWIKRIFS